MDLTALTAALATRHHEPTVIRLSGPGAVALANAWAADTPDRHVDVKLGARLPRPGVVWLHDGPGARSVADAWIAESALFGRGFSFLLTGPARDGGHPRIGQSASIDGSAASPVGAARVHVPEVPAIEPALDSAAAHGDVRLSLALLERLEEASDPSAPEWRWVELWRLASTGRLDEVPTRAFTLGVETCKGGLYAQLAIESFRTQDYDDGRDLAHAALASPELPERVHQDMRYFLRVFEDGIGSPDVRPGSPHRVSVALAMWARRHPECGVELRARDDLWARQLVSALDSEEDPEPWLGINALQEAARALGSRSGASPATVLYEHRGADRAYFGELDALLDDQQLETARDRLEQRAATFRDRPTFGGTIWALYWGRVNAELGDAAQTAWARARLDRIGVRSLPPGLAQRAIPSGNGPDPWCVGHWLEGLFAFLPELEDELVARAERLPSERVALGPYALVAPLASGGMGTVWRARHVIADRPVAIKVLRALGDHELKLFRREVDLACGFEHPCIATVLDRVDVERVTAIASRGAIQFGQPALVMELVEHGSLADLQGELVWPELRDVLLALLDALAYVHSHGVVHRDLKPENVLTTKDHRLRLCDFGLASFQNRIAGTPSFMAPEQFRTADVGPAADLYALGCTAWALCTGLPPYLGPPHELAAAHAAAPLPPLEPYYPVPDGFHEWLQTCLAKSPRDRFRSAAAAAEALLALPVPVRHLGARRSAPAIPQPTFQLPTLLDLPPPPPDSIDPQNTLTLRTLHDVFLPHHDVRPRLPTSNLLDAGDPPLLWQSKAQGELWTLLMQATRGRSRHVALQGAPSQGARSLVRWLTRKARIAGLHVNESPMRGSLSIVDATGTDHEDWADCTHEPWLIVWRASPPADTRVVRLNRLTPLQTWWLLDTRVLMTSETVARAATLSLAYPSLALRSMEAWLEDPGVRMTADGLAPMRAVPDSTTRGRRWWRDRWSGWDPVERDLATRLAVHAPWFSEDVVDQETRHLLPNIAYGLNGAWCLAPDLRDFLVASFSPEERAAHHRAAADAHPPGTRRAWHLLLADPSAERVIDLATAQSSRRVQVLAKLTNAALQRYRMRFLVAHPTVTAVADVARATPDDLVAFALGRGLRSSLAFLALCVLSRHIRPDVRAHQQRRLDRAFADGPLDTVFAQIVKGFALAEAAAGHHDAAVRRIDEALAHTEPSIGRDTLVWLRLRLTEECDIRTLDRIDDPGTRVRAALDIANSLISSGRMHDALPACAQARGLVSVVGDYNTALCHLATGDMEAVRQCCHQVTPVVHMMGRREVSHGLFAMTLAAELHDEGPAWESLANRCDPVSDPALGRHLHAFLDGQPGSQRVETLRRLIDGR